MVTPSQLRELLDYDSATGELTWRPRPDTSKGNRVFNAKFSGKPAFTYVGSEGYKLGSIHPHTALRAHRVIWALVHGYWPKFIDHINGDRLDNRLCNLREVSKVQNARNQRLRSDNTSGFMGVTWHVASGKWRVRVQGDTSRIHVGMFCDLDDAIAAKVDAERRLGYSPNHNRQDK